MSPSIQNACSSALTCTVAFGYATFLSAGVSKPAAVVGMDVRNDDSVDRGRIDAGGG